MQPGSSATALRHGRLHSRPERSSEARFQLGEGGSRRRFRRHGSAMPGGPEGRRLGEHPSSAQCCKGGSEESSEVRKWEEREQRSSGTKCSCHWRAARASRSSDGGAGIKKQPSTRLRRRKRLPLYLLPLASHLRFARDNNKQCLEGEGKARSMALRGRDSWRTITEDRATIGHRSTSAF